MNHYRRRFSFVGKMANSRMHEAISDSLAHGGKFFTAETVEFWNSRVVAGMFDNDTFVTSEDNFDRSKTLYTARRYHWGTHTEETIGEFQQFHTWEAAAEFAKNYKE